MLQNIPPRGQAEILLVEDNPGDVRLMQEALGQGPTPKRLTVVEDGEEALAYLGREGKYKDAARPDLIFLDLNLPRRDGREVLAAIKSNPQWKIIPVVVITTSDADRDILQAYDLHANCYVRKPVDLEGFLDVIRSCENFWLSIVRLPVR